MSSVRSKSKRANAQRNRLRPSMNGSLMTPEEFQRAQPDDGDPAIYELIRGVLIVSPPPGEAERDPNEELGMLLRVFRAHHPEGRVLDKTLSEQQIHFADNSRRADRAIWTGLGRIPDIHKDIPTIAVEFVSKRRRDRLRDYEEKRSQYLSAGVREYWVIDRFQRRMTVYLAPPADPAEIVIQADGVYRTPLLPGFELPLAQLLSLADDWNPRDTPKPASPPEGTV